MSKNNPASRWQVSTDLLSSKIDDEIIIMGLQTDKYYGLDAIASRIWELLEAPRSLDELVSLLCEEYEVEEAVCREETSALLQALSKQQLIRELKNP
jgi:hypothetical protein